MKEIKEIAEFKKLKKRVLKLMSGGAINDGIGAFAAAQKISKEFKMYYAPEEVHCIWLRGQPWYKGDSFPEVFDDKTTNTKTKSQQTEEVDDEDVVS